MKEILIRAFGTSFLLAFAPMMIICAKQMLHQYMENDDEACLGFFIACILTIVCLAITITLIWTDK